jgi:uncharacterized protein (DUF1778 family)
VVVEKQKKSEDLHMRLSEEEKALIAQACTLTGAAASAKARELLVTWARFAVARAKVAQAMEPIAEAA